MLNKETILAQAKIANMDPIDFLLRRLELETQAKEIFQARAQSFLERSIWQAKRKLAGFD